MFINHVLCYFRISFGFVFIYCKTNRDKVYSIALIRKVFPLYFLNIHHVENCLNNAVEPTGIHILHHVPNFLR
jgi:hypothetical protein